MEGRDCNKVVFVVLLKVEESMTYLFDVDSAGEGGFLGVVALKLKRAMIVSALTGIGRKMEETYSNAMLLIRYTICSDRWVVATIMLALIPSLFHSCVPDLLRYEFCSARLVLPFSKK